METSNSIPRTVPEQLFRHQHSDGAALRHANQTLSYAELYSAAKQFADYLAERNISSGSTVAICMERSFDWIVAAFGVLLTGAAYVPLDSTWPEARIQFALHDSGAKAVVARPELLARLKSNLHNGDLHGIDLSRDKAPIAAALPRTLKPADLDDLAYIIYTSGSSGTPKGVDKRRLVVKWVE